MNKTKTVSFAIPLEAVEHSGFAPEGEFTLHAGESLLAMTPREMTALQAAQAIGALTEITTGLLEAIQSACGSCEERREQGLCPSGHLEDPEQCPLKRMTGHGVTVDAGARAEAGIPLDAKLEVFVDEGELAQWRRSHQANVKCARDIKNLIASHARDGQLEPDCARTALDWWGFPRVQFVLSSTATPERKAEMDRELRRTRNEMFAYPYYAQCNSSYKCLHYCRYADDFIISVIGSKQDAEQIKADVKDFLASALKLELSEEKTKVTHSSDFARFLGYDICISRSDAIKYNEQGVAKREYSGRVMLYVPKEKWMGKLLEYHTFKIKYDETGKEIWKTVHRGKLVNHPDIEIITKFNAEIRGLYNYYRLANNVSVLGKFAYIMEYSMYKTFACKYRTTVSKIIDRYSDNGIFYVPYQTKTGTKRCEFYHDGFKRIKEVLMSADTLPEYVRKYTSPNSNAA